MESKLKQLKIRRDKALQLDKEQRTKYIKEFIEICAEIDCLERKDKMREVVLFACVFNAGLNAVYGDIPIRSEDICYTALINCFVNGDINKGFWTIVNVIKMCEEKNNCSQ